MKARLREQQQASTDQEQAMQSRISQLLANVPIQGWRFDNLRQMEVNLRELAVGLRQLDPSRNTANQLRHRVRKIDIMDLRFTHATVCTVFQNGTHVGQHISVLIEELKNGSREPEQVEPLLVLRSNKHGNEVVCGNRRLYCFRVYANELKALEKVICRCLVWDMDKLDRDN